MVLVLLVCYSPVLLLYCLPAIVLYCCCTAGVYVYQYCLSLVAGDLVGRGIVWKVCQCVLLVATWLGLGYRVAREAYYTLTRTSMRFYMCRRWL
jgi:hypothetical protein